MKAGTATPDESADDNATSTTSVRWALAGLSLSILMPSLDTSIANAGLPVLAQAFGASFQAMQWIVLAYLLALTTLIVSVGRWGDLVGRRRLLLTGVAVFTVASLLCGIAPTLALLIAARAAQGLGAAIMLALTVALVGETAAITRTGSAMGLLGTMSAIGTTAGPSLGGLLIAGFGWQSIFLVNVPLGIVNFLLVYRYVPVDLKPTTPGQVSFDYKGTAQLALALAAYALAMTMGHGDFGVLNMVLLLIAGSGLVFFIRIEKTATAPLIDLRMFRNRVLSGSLAMSMLVSTVIMSTLVVGPFYLARALGLEGAMVGLVLSMGPLVSALTGVPAGRLVDKFGAQRTSIVGLIGMATACMALSLLPASLGVVGYLIPIVCTTSCYALFQAANNTVIMTSVNLEQRGVIAGLLNLSRNLGLITGAAVMGAIFTFATAATNISTASANSVATGMRFTFGVAALLIVVALSIATVSSSIARRAP